MDLDELPVVFVYPSDWKGPLRPHPRAWHLKSDEPGEALLRFASRAGARIVAVSRETASSSAPTSRPRPRS